MHQSHILNIVVNAQIGLDTESLARQQHIGEQGIVMLEVMSLNLEENTFFDMSISNKI